MKIIVTFGTFDLFHVGHLNLLLRARDLGDCLHVGISSDELNYQKKGRQAVYPESDRMRIIGALKCVDSVFLEESLEQKRHYIESRKADVLVMGDDWAGKFDYLADICDVVYLERTPTISTTVLVRQIRRYE